MRCKGEAESPAREAVAGWQVSPQGFHSAATPEGFVCVPCAVGRAGNRQRLSLMRTETSNR